MLLAHQAAWEFASHEQEAHAGHGYLQYGAILAALGAAAVLVAATAQLIHACRGGEVACPPSARVFAVVPLVGFTLQEHLEHLVFARELEVTFFLSKPFLLGLVLQLPFAFAALIVARLILGLVKNVARDAGMLRILTALGSLQSCVAVAVDLPRRHPLALRYAGRAPPPSAH